MKIVRKYRKMEDIEEISIYGVEGGEFYRPCPQEFDVVDVPFNELLNNIPADIHVLIPHDDGNDFIVSTLGAYTLKLWNFDLNDIKGRLLSKISPMFYKLLKDYGYEVYHSHKTKNLRFLNYTEGKMSSITNVKIIYEKGFIFVVTEHIGADDDRVEYADEEKINMIEYLSQTGSFYIVNGRYKWTQGVYSIINRARESYDDYYNILFDLVIPEDKHLIDDFAKIMESGVSHHEEVIRIKTVDGVLKYIELDVYSNFDDEGNFTNYYGLVNDVTHYSEGKITRPVDFLLNGFKNSKKLALMIEPLNVKQYEFSKGFYYLIEKTPDEYVHSREVADNIVEDDAKREIIRLVDGEIDKLDVTFAYNVDGDESKQKICELYIERFEFGGEVHSMGFLADVTEERKKQLDLMEANEHKEVLIKEVHHRVKNNLQVLDSFLNLEKRFYRDDPYMVIDHMQSRLSSLALLHKKSYDTNDFTNINLNDFITDRDNQIKSANRGIEFVSDVDETINLSVEVITPLLLIIEELTVNAIKHAFVGMEDGDKMISKHIEMVDSDNVRLVFRDSGVGVESPDVLIKSLGFEIIKSLTGQLDADLKLIEHENGVGYELVFPARMLHTIGGG